MITIDADFTPLVRYLDELRRKQLPYVTARSLTKLAQLGQEQTRASLPRNFTLRSNWVRNGIRIVRGEKRDWPNVTAIVGTIDWFMEAQETGKDRTPRPGREQLSVPGTGVRPTKETKITRAKWPKALLAGKGRRRAFIAVLTQGRQRGRVAVLRRASSDRHPLQVLYVFNRNVRGKKRLGMVITVTATVRDHYESVFRETMQLALKPRATKT